MVLQLVMFFMMVANFSMEQVNSDIRLPVAQSARPMDKTEMEDVLYLNVNEEGHVVVAGRDLPLTTIAEINTYLAQKKTDYARDAEDRGLDPNSLETLVIIRGDRNADYRDVYNVLQACKQQGFRKWQVRAITKAG